MYKRGEAYIKYASRVLNECPALPSSLEPWKWNGTFKGRTHEAEPGWFVRGASISDYRSNDLASNHSDALPVVRVGAEG